MQQQDFDGEELDEGWTLTEDDRAILTDIAGALKSLADRASAGADLIGLGEALVAIDQILEGSEVDVNVSLSLGFRSGDKDFKEGLFVGCRINGEEIVLDELNTSYASDYGSDRSSVTHAELNCSGYFSGFEVQCWLLKLRQVMAFEEAQLHAFRDHI